MQFISNNHIGCNNCQQHNTKSSLTSLTIPSPTKLLGSMVRPPVLLLDPKFKFNILIFYRKIFEPPDILCLFYNRRSSQLVASSYAGKGLGTHFESTEMQHLRWLFSTGIFFAKTIQNKKTRPNLVIGSPVWFQKL